MGTAGTILKLCSWWANPKILYVKYSNQLACMMVIALLLLMFGDNASKVVSESGVLKVNTTQCK